MMCCVQFRWTEILPPFPHLEVDIVIRHEILCCQAPKEFTVGAGQRHALSVQPDNR